MDKLIYPAVFSPLEALPSGYCVEFPDLPGCITQGRTLQEAFAMAEDAASGWILTSIEDGACIPPASDILYIKPHSAGSFVSLVQVDVAEYAKLHGDKAVNKTLTIPNWLNVAAEREGLNFSQVLQDALKAKLQAGN